MFFMVKETMKVYCFDKCMVYLVNLDQRNLLKRKGMSYIMKQHIYVIYRMQGK